MEIVERLVAGDAGAAARLISWIEDEDPSTRKALAEIHKHTGNAHVVGVTGPPGSGKSTLVDALVREYRLKGLKVGVIAVDPSSPFTGGAILGDRIRMQKHCTDPGVFIRSMGTRGRMGGLAKGTADAVKVLDAYGCDVVIVETVGAGQAEVDIVKSVHTVIVVEVPGMGDDIQAIKAGILEIGDIFAVNKSDREGADRAVAELKAMLELGTEGREWTPPIVMTVAKDGKGVAELAGEIAGHRAHLGKGGRLRAKERARTEREFRELLRERLAEYIESKMDAGEFEVLVERILKKKIDPYAAADGVLKKL
ncbi:MAG: methylmalonyl Co-A mutase-associated GTPase MeaB [Methanobacteriota archaeon]